MAVEYRYGYCATCLCVRRFRRRGLDHRFHAALTAATLGLWAFGWATLMLRASRSRAWRCGSCHHRFKPEAEQNPVVSLIETSDDVVNADDAALEILKAALSENSGK